MISSYCVLEVLIILALEYSVMRLRLSQHQETCYNSIHITLKCAHSLAVVNKHSEFFFSI